MATVKLNATEFGYVDQETPYTHYSVDNNTWYKVAGFAPSLQAKRFLTKFAPLPSALKHNKLIGVQIMACLSAQGTLLYDATIYYGVLPDAFDGASVTWATANIPELSFESIGLETKRRDDQPSDEETPDSVVGYWANHNAAKALIKSGCAFAYNNANLDQFIMIRPKLLADGLIYATITYDELVIQTSQITYKSGPRSGYSNPRNATEFGWSYTPVDSSIICADDSFTQQSATFYWKTSTDESYQSVAITGDTKTVTIPANTFPTASTIQWYVSGTDEDGTTTQTDVFNFSTAAGTVTAKGISPVQSVEDGSAPITLRWSLSSTDGQTPSRIRSSWRKETDPDEQQYWNNLFDTTTIGNSFVVPANTFPAGGIVWNIIAWNVDGVEGNRDYNTFICVAAPEAPEGLSATEVPLTTVSWQSAEQQAYEISIDGVIVKRAFGTDVYSWHAQEPLSEGDHVITVRVQGQYGFWSQPSEITITVSGRQNTTVLHGVFGVDADLTTEASSPGEEIRWYRDGELIGTSRVDGQNQAAFVDRHVLGSHSYFARRFHANGEDYDQSETVFGTMEAREMLIAPYDGSADWLSLRLSENRDNQESFSWKKTHATQRVKGAVYPRAEGSDFESLSANYNCSFVNETDLRRFEALKGKIVILKSRGNNVVVGMMAQISKKVNRFFTAYTFSIEQIHAEDYSEQ